MLRSVSLFDVSQLVDRNRANIILIKHEEICHQRQLNEHNLFIHGDSVPFGEFLRTLMG